MYEGILLILGVASVLLVIYIAWDCIGRDDVLWDVVNGHSLDILKLKREYGKIQHEWNVEHINSRCSLTPYELEKALDEKISMEKARVDNEHVDFFRNHYPNSKGIYKNRIGNVCILFEKEHFDFDSSVCERFLEEFGIPIGLMSISKGQDDGILVVLHPATVDDMVVQVAKDEFVDYRTYMRRRYGHE
jgi:hypothetical protein